MPFSKHLAFTLFIEKNIFEKSLFQERKDFLNILFY